MDNIKTKNIKQTVALKGTPHEVYEMLINSKKHSAFTGSKAVVSQKEGGRISAWDGYIDGKNIKLITDKKIVQSWRAIDWPKGHYSTVTYALTKTKGGTKLTFVQTSVPADFCTSIKQGWVDYYWTPLKAHFPR